LYPKAFQGASFLHILRWVLVVHPKHESAVKFILDGLSAICDWLKFCRRFGDSLSIFDIRDRSLRYVNFKIPTANFDIRPSSNSLSTGPVNTLNATTANKNQNNWGTIERYADWFAVGGVPAACDSSLGCFTLLLD
jgi:hypothetical protein